MLNKDWQKIPRGKLIQVSERKFMRLRANVDWKQKREFDAEVSRLKAEALTAWKQAEIYQHQHLTNMQNAVEWMDKYMAAAQELAHYKLAEKVSV